MPNRTRHYLLILLSLSLLPACGEPTVEIEATDEWKQTLEATPELQKKTKELEAENSRLTETSDALELRVRKEELQKEAEERLISQRRSLLSSLRGGQSFSNPVEDIVIGPNSFHDTRDEGDDWNVYWPRDGFDSDISWGDAELDDRTLLFPSRSGVRGTIRIHADQFRLRSDDRILTDGNDIVVVANAIFIDGEIDARPVATEDKFYRGVSSDGEEREFLRPPSSGTIALLASVVEVSDGALILADGADALRLNRRDEVVEPIHAINWDQRYQELLAIAFRSSEEPWVSGLPPHKFDSPESLQLLRRIAEYWATQVRLQINYARSSNYDELASGKYLRPFGQLEDRFDEYAFREWLLASPDVRRNMFEAQASSHIEMWKDLIESHWPRRLRRLAVAGSSVNNAAPEDFSFFLERDRGASVALEIATSRQSYQPASNDSVSLFLPNEVSIVGNIEGGGAGDVVIVALEGSRDLGMGSMISTVPGQGLEQQDLDIEQALATLIDETATGGLSVGLGSKRRMRISDGQLQMLVSQNFLNQVVFYVNGQEYRDPNIVEIELSDAWLPVEYSMIDRRIVRNSRGINSSNESEEDLQGLESRSGSGEQSISFGSWDALRKTALSWGVVEEDFPESWHYFSWNEEARLGLSGANLENEEDLNRYTLGYQESQDP